jgi:L-ascorbate metabolism protein UlaG (beta-lactamase superfamily)
MPGLIDRVHWLGHAGFAIRNGKTIYFDPYKIEATAQADLVLITHEHFDHCSPDDVQAIVRPSTVIVTVAGNRSKLATVAGEIKELRCVEPGETVTVDDVLIEAVPAYNTDKNFHPKSNGWVGFVVEVDGERIYHAGDTDLIPEMEAIRCDIALLPVSGTYVMTAAQAIDAAARIGPKIAVPMHYGDIVGDRNDAEAFRAGCSCDVRILDKE